MYKIEPFECEFLDRIVKLVDESGYLVQGSQDYFVIANNVRKWYGTNATDANVDKEIVIFYES